MKQTLIACATIVCGGWGALHAAEPSTQRENRAAVAVPRDARWQEAHAVRDARLGRSGDIDVLLIGDSITSGWDDHKELAKRVFGDWKVFNLGHPADKTENILWRIENHHFEKVRARVAVVMAGTNNSNGEEYSAEEIAGGIEAIVRALREKLPQTKVLLLGIFPRGSRERRVDRTLTEAGVNPQWEKNDQASRLASRIADGEDVVYLNINQAFLDDEGKLSRAVMPDLLHANEKGYAAWGTAMRPTLEKMLGSQVARDKAADGRAKPNVLFIAVDDLNHWVGYLGRNAQTRTPNIDRLARRGVWFTRSYCAAPVCNPSRAALMSGLRPGASGVYDNNQAFTAAIPPEITLATQFRKAGYFVCGSGKIYHGSRYRPEEWDDAYPGKPSRGDEDELQEVGAVMAGKLPIGPLNCRDEDMPDYAVVDYATGQLSRRHDKPFFIACGLYKPHLPFSVPKKYYERFPLESIELPPYKEGDLSDLPPIAQWMVNRRWPTDHEAILAQGGTATWKQAVQAYLATINFCDAMVGRLLDAYDKSPERDNTIICFWGDHGWHLGEKGHWRKFALWEESTRAPLIWVVPGLTKPDSRCDRTVDFMSIYPTLMDLCGLPTPGHVQGKSIRALLVDPQAAWEEPAVTTYLRDNHTVRSEGWRYTRYADGGEELYDEAKDPYEWSNLAREGGGDQAVKSALRKYLPAENVSPAENPRSKAKVKQEAATR